MTITKSKANFIENFLVCSFARLFVKLPESGNRKVTFAVFESS